MSHRPKTPPNVWAKSLAKLLAGDDRCWFKGWYLSNHWVPREEQTEEDRKRLEAINAKHDAIAERRAEELRAEGYVVKREDDAAFKLRGKVAELAGKPDVVGMLDRADEGEPCEAVVSDAKGGKPRASDVWQVLVYMFALPLSWLGQGFRLRGEVQYEDHREEVPPLTDGPEGTKQVRKISEGVRRLASRTPPEATPSKWECKWCRLECPVRWKEEDHAGDAREFF